MIGQFCRERSDIDIFCDKKRSELFDRKHVIDRIVIETLPPLCKAGTDKHGNAVGIFLLCNLRRVVHGASRFGHAGLQSRHVNVYRAHVRRTARRRHKHVTARHTLFEFFRFSIRADIRTESDFEHVVEAQSRKRRFELAGSGFELCCDRGRIERDDAALFLHDMLDNVDELAFIHHRTEGTLAHAATAKDAFIVIDFFVSRFVFADRADGTRFFAGYGNFNNRVIRTVLHAQPAVDALRFIDNRSPVYRDRFARTVHHARARKTALTRVRNHVVRFYARVARIVQNGEHGPGRGSALECVLRVFGKRAVVVVIFDRYAEPGKDSHAQNRPVVVDTAAYRF